MKEGSASWKSGAITTSEQRRWLDLEHGRLQAQRVISLGIMRGLIRVELRLVRSIS